MPMPEQKPGRSKQDYRTPPAFLRAVKERWAIEEFDCDLAADVLNRVCEHYYCLERDALVHPWKLGDGWNWLNPPFGKLAPWVMRGWKQREESGARTLILVPAGVGSNWWAEWVHEKALVLLLRPRMTFMDETDPYPKDLCLLVYAPDVQPGYQLWKWK